MLWVNNVRKTYPNGYIAIKNIHLHIEKGDLYGFIGANGAGKTTLLKAIAGIHPFEGEIIVNGHTLMEESVKAKEVMAYIPDSPELYSHMSGAEYISFIADIFKLDDPLRSKKIKYYTDLFEMTEHIQDEISTYSHGMRQRIAIISALIHSPKLMLLDEPFVGLDPKATLLLREALIDLCKEGGSVFFSTHVLEVAEKICNKIAIIQKGEIVAMGETKELIKDKSLEDVFMEVLE